jgi:hypothetical protein
LNFITVSSSKAYWIDIDGSPRFSDLRDLIVCPSVFVPPFIRPKVHYGHKRTELDFPLRIVEEDESQKLTLESIREASSMVANNTLKVGPWRAVSFLLSRV